MQPNLCNIYMKEALIINYTGRIGGGALDAYETAKALVEEGEIVIPILSNQIENLNMWKKINFEKIILLDTYSNRFSFIVSTLLFPVKQKIQIKKALKNYRIKAVYSPMSTFWTKAINDIFKNAKKIVVNHDPIPHSGARKLSIWLMERPYQSADMIIVHSKTFLVETRKKYNKVEYLPLGKHNIYKYQNNKTSIIEYNKDKINFLMFGRITKYKGIDLLIEAYKLLEEKYDGITTLSIVGNGNFQPYMDEFSKLHSARLINRWIRDEEVESVFSGTNLISVCPYKDATQSGVILVSYDYSVPVIASRTGGIEEQVWNLKTGVLINPDNVYDLFSAMEYFVQNPNMIIEMKDYINEFMETVSWANTAKGIIKLINSI